ncbi:flagellar basal body-associated FliL family protein [Rheinheimera sp. WS51]|uniref:flagellar basal body-associated FliL family protein n=1 Tax=Rheinheimera sp. WS51 TaxID=3425886 RepID=UPI003D8FD161
MLKQLLATFILLASFSTTANDVKPEVVYYGFDADIVTNYVTADRRAMGYLRVVVELMLEDKAYLALTEHHEPLILDTIISTFSQQPESTIKSLVGREEIRQMILQKIQQKMQDETGDIVVRDILFTKYLYQ